ncbi:MAG: FAD-dependent oxidoreductase [Desulfobacterota bacterium]|nr:FAD-dependent oxidoreductase [Thermodesulfobacteriota bacterium]MDW8001489.1 FAD-dependent oxidoreductase [Deltaproteobacteria bacterium]
MVKRVHSIEDRTLIPPCQDACPLDQDIREYVDLIAQGRIMEALRVIRDKNPFPSICAFVCPHKCEEKCRRRWIDKPIAIRALKRFAVEFGGDRMVREKVEDKYQERIAIVGSGPAGLSCAYYLRILGYPVTIFEALSEPGGMLRVGIPEFRLPKKMLDLEIERLTQMGIEIRVNTPVTSLDLLFEKGYKAIFVTVGAHQGRKLGIEGEDTDGVVDGISFLREINLGLKMKVKERVTVVGGGGVAADCALAAIRLGAKRVDIVCLERKEEMPAGKDEIKLCEDEGVIIHPGFGVKAVITEERSVKGLKLIRCLSVFDEQKRFNPKFDESETYFHETDMVIFAIGQMPKIPEDFHLHVERGTIKVDPVTLTTSREGVFAGGDAVTGPASVVEALATGKKAAKRIDDYLRMRYPLEDKKKKEKVRDEMNPRTVEMIRKISRIEPPLKPKEERIERFEPFELVYDWKSAFLEAKRCLRCGIGAEILHKEKCASCLRCVRVCPYSSPFVDEKGDVEIPASECVACGICVSECPAKAIFLRKPSDRRQIELELLYLSSRPTREKSFYIVGFVCQYGLFGEGSLARFFSIPKTGVHIVPVLCIGKLETEHIVEAFELNAQGVFIAACGEERCARQNTEMFAKLKAERAKEIIQGLGLEPERIRLFSGSEKDVGKTLDDFIEVVSKIILKRTLTGER